MYVSASMFVYLEVYTAYQSLCWPMFACVCVRDYSVSISARLSRYAWLPMFALDLRVSVFCWHMFAYKGEEEEVKEVEEEGVVVHSGGNFTSAFIGHLRQFPKLPFVSSVKFR